METLVDVFLSIATAIPIPTEETLYTGIGVIFITTLGLVMRISLII